MVKCRWSAFVLMQFCDATVLTTVSIDIQALADESETTLVGHDAQAAAKVDSSVDSTRSKLVRWTLIVGEYGLVQIAVQLTGAIAGFIIVRSLPKPEYALYAVANSGLSMFNVLADTGISPALRSIGGEVHDDRQCLSELVVTATQLRHAFSAIAFLISFPVMVWMLLSNGATILQTVVLCMATLAACWPLLTATVLKETALLLGNYRKVQVAEFATSAVRLMCVLGMAAWLTSLLGVAFAGIGNWVQWLIYHRRANEEVDKVAVTNRAYRKRILAISMPMLPNVLFYCFQGQITFVLLTLFGTTTSVADIAALGRLATLLSVFGAVFHSVLAPRFSRCQDTRQLPRMYLGLASIVGLSLLPMVVLAMLFPQVLLWILGDAYAGMERECLLIIVAGCLTQFGGAILWLNFSRAWIRIYGYINVLVILVAQVVSIIAFDVGTVRGVIYLSIVSAIVPLPIYLADAWLGMRASGKMINNYLT